MPYQHMTFDNAEDVLFAISETLAPWCAAGRVPVLLAPTPAAVLRLRRALADGSCSFGVRVETPDSWVADQWEIYGDGRALVQGGERDLLMQRACFEMRARGNAVEPTPGTVSLLAGLARESLPALLDALACDERQRELSAAQRGALAVLGRYAGLLDELSLCERSQAACALSRCDCAFPPLVLAGFDDIGQAYGELFDALAERGDVVRLDDGCRAPSSSLGRSPELTSLLDRLFLSQEEGPLEPTGAVRFLLPAGRYAACGLVLSCVTEAVAAERSRSARPFRRAGGSFGCQRDMRGGVFAPVVRGYGVRALVSGAVGVCERRFLSLDPGFRFRVQRVFGLGEARGVRTRCGVARRSDNGSGARRARSVGRERGCGVRPGRASARRRRRCACVLRGSPSPSHRS